MFSTGTINNSLVCAGLDAHEFRDSSVPPGKNHSSNPLGPRTGDVLYCLIEHCILTGDRRR